MNRTSFVTGFLCIVAGVSIVLLLGAWLLAGCGKSSQIVIPNGMGAISVPDDGNSYELWVVPAAGRGYVKYTAQPAVVVPPNTYQLVQYYARNPQNTNCWVTGSSRVQFTVAAGSTTELKIGGPYTAQVSANGSGSDRVSLGLAVADSGGNQCSFRAASSPRFQILSTSGQILQEGSFSYG